MTRGSTSRNISRIFCPVLDCLHADVQNARGWSAHAAMRPPHLNDHCAGRFQGEIPSDYLSESNLQICQHCGQLIHKRFNRCCPRCRPSIRIEERRILRENAVDDLPSLDDIAKMNIRTVKYVPRGARELWSQCLTRAIAAVCSNNDLKHWKDFLMISKCILAAPPRQGKAFKDQTLPLIKSRAQRWMNGERDSLWEELCMQMPGTRSK